MRISRSFRYEFFGDADENPGNILMRITKDLYCNRGKNLKKYSDDSS